MAMMTGLWLLSLARRDASIVDPFWGTGFVVVTWLSLASAGPARADARSWLLTILVTIWGARLSLYLLWRNRGHGEDKRYRAMREHHGSRFWWVSLLTVFCCRESSCGLFRCQFRHRCSGTGSQFIGTSGSPLGWLDLAGVSVWCIGLFFEAVGDYQMAQFQADSANAGRVMDRGLWRLHSASELLRGFLRLVGRVPDRGKRRSCVDCLQPCPDVIPAAQSFRSEIAGENHHRPPP